MTNQTFPITPPPELVDQWDGHGKSRSDAAQILATQAAQWGWDQRGEANEAELQKARDEELNACCAEVSWFTADILRAARRPKPPSLKEQALAALGYLQEDEPNYQSSFDVIRQALEALPND